MREIERQFLCPPPDPETLEGGRRTEIVQGYITPGDPAVRVRRAVGPGGAARWILTVKSGAGRVREEVEAEVGDDDGEALLRMAGGRTLRKVRHRLGRWEIDVFGGPLAGLVAAEVELEREDEPLPDPPPGLELGPEVTDEPRWTNQSLAHLDADGARAAVGEARRRLGAPAPPEEESPWTP